MNISDIQKEIHNISTEKGFWNHMDSVLDKMIKLNEDNDAYKLGVDFTDDEIKSVKSAFLCQKLILIVSEIGESVEADRKEKRSYLRNIEMVKFGEMSFEDGIKDTFEDEIADSLIRILDLCKKFNIDIEWHINQKVNYNKNREKMHGKKY